MVPHIASAHLDESPAIVLRILNDPTISPEIKATYFRLCSHKIMEKLLEKTPISAIFWICEEYRKHPDIYDEVLSGNVKFYLKGSMQEAKPLIDAAEINEFTGLESLFNPNSLIRQAVDKFSSFGLPADRIKRIAIEVNGNKMLTVAFNSEKRIISMLEDYIKKSHRNHSFLKFICRSAKKRIDFINN